MVAIHFHHHEPPSRHHRECISIVMKEMEEIRRDGGLFITVKNEEERRMGGITIANHQETLRTGQNPGSALPARRNSPPPPLEAEVVAMEA
ncbi:hypothetical protein TanjilG_15526 [Lupinus angustifolius]|nr:hypothetical protein TanjilG_15526 [Lupinus angustifolius]